MNYSDLENQLRHQLATASGTNADDWFLVYRARYGMEIVFESTKRLLGGGSVITQSFICATAVNPVLAAGLRPVYADISPDTLSVDMTKLRVPEDAHALVLPHIFGIPGDMKAARALSDKQKLVLVEDSAHCLGYIAQSPSGKPLADISVHSFGAEKTLSTRFGGAIWVNPAFSNKDLAGVIRQALQELPVVPWRLSRVGATYRTANGLLNRLPAQSSKLLRRSLLRAQLLTPPVAPAELQGRQATTPAKPAAWMIRKIIHEMRPLDSLLQTRQIASAVYGVAAPAALVPAEARTNRPLLRFPVILPTPQDAAAMLQSLQGHGLYIGKWYNPTLFPGVDDPDAYGYDPALCPVAEDIAARIINLPTNVSSAKATEISRLVFS